MTRHGPKSTRSAALALSAMGQLAPAITTLAVMGSGTSRLRQMDRAIQPRSNPSAATNPRPGLGSVTSGSAAN